MIDIRDEIFRCKVGRQYSAVILAADHGILAETKAAAKTALELGLSFNEFPNDGTEVHPGNEIVRITGGPKQIAMAEDRLIGTMAKPSGIATSAKRFSDLAGARPRIVSGAWKKMPLSQKEAIRRAIVVGGAGGRICDEPFLYLDKNYVKILGGLAACLDAVAGINGHVPVIQLKGDEDIGEEACLAARHGAGIIFIDTGWPGDLDLVSRALNQAGLRSGVELAFGGGVRLDDIELLKTMDVDILDIGRPIVDAPLLDMRMEILEA